MGITKFGNVSPIPEHLSGPLVYVHNKKTGAHFFSTTTALARERL
jgi:hypothetical protein